MFESKRTQILIEFLGGTKKVQLAAKKSFLVSNKSSARFYRNLQGFFAVGHPICDVWNSKETQILIEFLDGTKKVQLAAKKSFLVSNKSSPRV